MKQPSTDLGTSGNDYRFLLMTKRDAFAVTRSLGKVMVHRGKHKVITMDTIVASIAGLAALQEGG